MIAWRGQARGGLATMLAGGQEQDQGQGQGQELDVHDLTDGDLLSMVGQEEFEKIQKETAQFEQIKKEKHLADLETRIMTKMDQEGAQFRTYVKSFKGLWEKEMEFRKRRRLEAKKIMEEFEANAKKAAEEEE